MDIWEKIISLSKEVNDKIVEVWQVVREHSVSSDVVAKALVDALVLAGASMHGERVFTIPIADLHLFLKITIVTDNSKKHPLAPPSVIFEPFYTVPPLGREKLITLNCPAATHYLSQEHIDALLQAAAQVAHILISRLEELTHSLQNSLTFSPEFLKEISAEVAYNRLKGYKA